MGHNASNYVLPILLCLFPILVTANENSKSYASTIIVIVVVIFLTVTFTLTYHIRRSGNLGTGMGNHQNTAEPRGLDAEEVESLPSLRFSKIKVSRLKEADQLECTVCLNEFEDQEVLRVLPDCYHVFHPGCIDPWLASNVTCPVCRGSLSRRHGSNVSRSTMLDRLTSSLSQISDHDDDQDRQDDDHHVVEIEDGSFDSNTEVNDCCTRRQFSFVRSHSAGDLLIQVLGADDQNNKKLPMEISPKSDYRDSTTSSNISATLSRRGCISLLLPRSKSDNSIDYSSLQIKSADNL